MKRKLRNLSERELYPRLLKELVERELQDDMIVGRDFLVNSFGYDRAPYSDFRRMAEITSSLYYATWNLLTGTDTDWENLRPRTFLEMRVIYLL